MSAPEPTVALAIERLEGEAMGWANAAQTSDHIGGDDETTAAMVKESELFAFAAGELARIAELEAENARLAKLVYVPGLWSCPKCKFSLVQANLNALDGTVTARDQPGDKCPNCDSPLWRVTERQAGNDMVDRAEEQMNRARMAEAEVERLKADNAHAWDRVERGDARAQSFEADLASAEAERDALAARVEALTQWIDAREDAYQRVLTTLAKLRAALKPEAG